MSSAAARSVRAPVTGAADGYDLPVLFADRAEAGEHLARRLAHLRDLHPVVLALPRGGVPVAAPVARALDAPLDILVVRRISTPGHREVAMGAVGEGGVVVINEEVVRELGVARDAFARAAEVERAEVGRRVRQLRRGPAIPLAGRLVVVVDDGSATGSTARAACQVALAADVSRCVVALPVASTRAYAALAHIADEVVCLQTPQHFHAVGQWYADFSAVSDDEVTELLSTEG